MSAPVRVVLDVDTGVDDAHALLLALRAPSIQVEGVTCVSGNVDVDTVCQATFKVLDAAGAPPELPVARGFDLPLVERVLHCPQIHGRDGLGDLQPPLPASSRKLVPQHGVEFIIQLLEQTEQTGAPPITIIALAPLTNIAAVIRLRPALVAKRTVLERIVWMGGSAFAGGNASQWGEANAEYDPEAAHIVLSSGANIPITMYSWDVYLNVEFSREELLLGGMLAEATVSTHHCEWCVEQGNCASKEEGNGATEEDNHASKSDGITNQATETLRSLPTWAALSTRLLLRDMKHFGGTNTAQIGDAGAVAAVICPSAIRTRRMHVAVELRGAQTRGMTVVDPREFVMPPDRPKQPANVDVAVGVDAASVKRIFQEHVLGLKPGASTAATAATTTTAPSI